MVGARVGGGVGAGWQFQKKGEGWFPTPGLGKGGPVGGVGGARAPGTEQISQLASSAAIARGGQNGLLKGDMSREATRCNNYQR